MKIAKEHIPTILFLSGALFAVLAAFLITVATVNVVVGLAVLSAFSLYASNALDTPNAE